MKCAECQNLLQSYELLKAHQSLANHCGTCKEPFQTTCKLLRHECKGPPAIEEPLGKKIKIKTEPVEEKDTSSMSSKVVLKNIDDESVPEISDSEMQGKKKKWNWIMDWTKCV